MTYAERQRPRLLERPHRRPEPHRHRPARHRRRRRPAHRRKSAAARGQAGAPASRRPPSAGGVLAQPSGPLTTPDSRFDVPGLSYVSGEISHSTLTRQRVRAVRLQRQRHHHHRHARCEDSLEDGVVMHRFATNAVIERTVVPAQRRRRLRAVPRHPAGTGQRRRPPRTTAATGSRSAAGRWPTARRRPASRSPATAPTPCPTASPATTATTASRSSAASTSACRTTGSRAATWASWPGRARDQGRDHRQPAHRPAPAGHRGARRRHRRDGHRQRRRRRGHRDLRARLGRRGPRQHHPGRAATTGSPSSASVGSSIVSYNVIAGVGPSALDTTRAARRASPSGEPDRSPGTTPARFWVKFRHYASPMTMLWTSSCC